VSLIERLIQTTDTDNLFGGERLNLIATRPSAPDEFLI
jgi:hypothetical protein